MYTLGQCTCSRKMVQSAKMALKFSLKPSARIPTCYTPKERGHVRQLHAKMNVIVLLLLCAVNFHGLPAYAEPSQVQGSKIDKTNVENACAEFNNEHPLGSGWFYSDCVAVWNGWTATLEEQQLMPWAYRETFAEMSTELRKRGNPCVVESVNYPDGAGSSAIRHLATWLFAEEMGCDWNLPITYSAKGATGDDDGSLYCHKMMPRGKTHPFKDQEPGDNRFWRCEVTNWLEFFHYSAHAARSTFSGSIKRVHAFIGGSTGSLAKVVNEYHLNATEGNLSWDHLVLYLGKSSANRFFQLAASWDGVKRDMTRRVLQTYRERFYEFPRPWFDNRPKCMYSSSPEELDFAIHVRLGDRSLNQNGFEPSYMDSLEAFMDTIAAAAIRRGLDTPMFHIFSETALPCPNQKTRTFPEFPAWPVEAFQIEPCLTPITPDECPEKRAGAKSCNPKRSGIFRVSGKPLYLHVGFDVQNELTCMAKADGILMGCSTFGQIAGVLNEGLKFFSFECSGSKTPNHYKMMPPLAVAERGDLWVPVEGSWHNPLILSDVIFEAALDEHLKNKEARLTEG